MHTIIEFHSIQHFSTKDLIFFKLVKENLLELHQIYSNSEVMQTLGGLRTVEESQEALNSNLKHWEENGFGLWMVYAKESDKFVGYCALRRVWVDQREEIEVAYAVLPVYWNRDFATQMAKACAEVAFEALRFNDLVCFTLPTNKASKRVMEKSGFEFEKNITHAGLEHLLSRKKNPKKVEIFPYDPNWIHHFKTEADRLKKSLNGFIREIHHFGSTSIPNMPAKAIIDILLECENLDEIDAITKKLNTLNYYNIRRHIIPHRSYFTRREDRNISFNLHIRERGDPQIKRHVNFREYLIHHPDVAQQYATLKINLAKQFSDNMNHYVLGKDRLVQEIDAKAKVWSHHRMDYLPMNTGPLAKFWTQEKIIKAMEANLNVHMTYYAQYLNQVDLIRIPGFTLVNSNLPDDTFNYVLEADFSVAEANAKIEEVVDYFAQRKVPYSWWISPHDKPADLAHHLECYDFKNTENNQAMYLDLDSWNEDTIEPSNLKILRAFDEKTLHDFALVLANDKDAFKNYFSWIASILTDDDPIEYYVGYVNGKPVVRGLICYYAQVAGLHWLSTAIDERKKGYGKAMQEYRLKRAKELGYHIAVLQASNEGYPLYLKLGYRPCGVFREFKQIQIP